MLKKKLISDLSKFVKSGVKGFLPHKTVKTLLKFLL